MREHTVYGGDGPYASDVAKLWDDTMEGHRRVIRNAALDGAASLVAEQGLGNVTMSQIATRAGIGRATLYKYFTDLDDVLEAWHARHINGHLDRLTSAQEAHTDVWTQLQAVLRAFCDAGHEVPSDAISASLHSRPHATEARQRLHDLIGDLIVANIAAGSVRSDVPPIELVDYCLYALRAATRHPTPEAVDRLLAVVLSGLCPSPLGDTTPIPEGESAPAEWAEPESR